MKETNKLSFELLEELGFSLVPLEKNPFPAPRLAYYVKNRVLLFFNTGKDNEGHFLVGYGDQHYGTYCAATIRWITTYEELKPLYEALTLKKL